MLRFGDQKADRFDDSFLVHDQGPQFGDEASQVDDGSGECSANCLELFRCLAIWGAGEVAGERLEKHFGPNHILHGPIVDIVAY